MGIFRTNGFLKFENFVGKRGNQGKKQLFAFYFHLPIDFAINNLSKNDCSKHLAYVALRFGP